MRIGTIRPEEARVFDSKAGFHRFQTEDGGPFFGSFEVFWHDGGAMGFEGEPADAGWYWHPCFPGCLPDGEPTGPFARSSQAYDDAQGEA